MAKKASPRRLLLRISLLLEPVAMLLFVINDAFKRRPRPSTVPLVSGIAPSGDGNTRPLSETQLKELEAWLRLHQQGWRRLPIPPAGSSYMVHVEHSDGAWTDVILFSSTRSEIYFSGHGEGGRFDHGWLHLPLPEVDDLIAMLRKER